jgi:hypothetical protein
MAMRRHGESMSDFILRLLKLETKGGYSNGKMPRPREIIWETEVWLAEVPAHLIHFGRRRCFSMGSRVGAWRKAF